MFINSFLKEIPFFWLNPSLYWFQVYLCSWLRFLVYRVKLFRMEPGNNWRDILHQDGSEFGDINIWPGATDQTSVFPFFWARLPFSQTTHCVDWESLEKYLQKPQKPGWRVRWGGCLSLSCISSGLVLLTTILRPSVKLRECSGELEPSLPRWHFMWPAFWISFQSDTIPWISLYIRYNFPDLASRQTGKLKLALLHFLCRIDPFKCELKA